MPTALDVDWLTIEKAAVAGISYVKLAQIHGVDENAIRQRAHRKKWAVPARIQAIAREVARMPDVPVTGSGGCNETEHNARIARVTAETLHDMHARTARTLAEASATALARFAEAAPAPENWQEAATAYKVQRLAAGIDKEGQQVRVNVSMFADQGQVRTVEVEAWDSPDVSEPVITSTQSLDSEGVE